jgi:hypothetical protein
MNIVWKKIRWETWFQTNPRQLILAQRTWTKSPLTWRLSLSCTQFRSPESNQPCRGSLDYAHIVTETGLGSIQAFKPTNPYHFITYHVSRFHDCGFVSYL